MLSTIILADDARPGVDPEARLRPVSRTLAALIGFVAADIVSDAHIVTRPDPRFDLLAERAGCSISADPKPEVAFTRAVERVRRPDVFVICAGYAPDRGLTDEINRLAEDAGETLPAMALLRQPDNFLERLFPQVAPVVGLVAPKAAFAGRDVEPKTLRRLARSLSAKPLRTRAINLD
jgi:hypothetical protein